MYKTVMLFMLLLGFGSHATESEYQQWKESRLSGLKKPHGWLSLVGLEWLHVGKNTIGSAEDNDIRLSHGPEYVGTIWLNQDKSMVFNPSSDHKISANEKIIDSKIPVYADTSEQETTVFTFDSYLFYVVEREKMALRIKDSQAKTRLEFEGLEYFPENEKFRIDAKFIPYEPVKIIPTVNVLGILTNQESPGRLEFSIDGVDYSLDALDSSDAYYMIFADKTNGKTTYGPGRFVYTDSKVDENGMVRIDFNKAYNPPCAFTAYSTCTLPPRQNRMPISVEAGEKKYANSVY